VDFLTHPALEATAADADTLELLQEHN